MLRVSSPVLLYYCSVWQGPSLFCSKVYAQGQTWRNSPQMLAESLTWGTEPGGWALPHLGARGRPGVSMHPAYTPFSLLCDLEGADLPLCAVR